jgi:hypothetical protein
LENLAQGVSDGSGLRRSRQCGNFGRQAFGLRILDVQRHGCMVPDKVERYQMLVAGAAGSAT